MKPAPPPVYVGTPCPKRWEDMRGDTRQRFCEHCQLHVHNLSAMSERERENFVAQSDGRGCITYQLRRDGTLITPSLWHSVLKPFRWIRVTITAGLATFLPFLHTACGEPKPGPILGKLVCPPPKNPPSKDDPSVKKEGTTTGTPKTPSKGGNGSSK